MVLELIDNRNIWDNFVEASPYGQLFHRWDFLRIIEKHSGYELRTYGVYKGKELVGIFPMFYKKYLGVKMLFSPPPQAGVHFLGFVMSSSFSSLKQRKKEHYLGLLFDDILKEMKRISPNYTALSLPPGFVDIREFKWNGFKDEINFTYVIDLKRPLDEIWESFDKECKREIRTSDKYNLVLKQVNDVETLYRIMRERYNQQGLNAMLLDQPYLEELLTAFPDNIKMYYLYESDEIVDVLLNYEYKGRITYWMGCVNLNKNVHALEYVTWELIKEKKALGFKDLELQGANVKRLCLFKSKFNPTLEPFFNVQKKDLFGKTAEFGYKNLLKKRWL
jgi:lipid II:glycine glycyltransferase (peptidoglycan interpeptide bridge formation enzyme)